jgi:hypothetical protein
VADVVERGLAFLLLHGQGDLLAGPEGGAGQVGGVETDLLAVGQPRLDPDADGAGNAWVGLLALQRLDTSQGGTDQLGRVLQAGGSGPVDLTARPEQDSPHDNAQCQHPHDCQHRPVATNRCIHRVAAPYVQGSGSRSQAGDISRLVG